MKFFAVAAFIAAAAAAALPSVESYGDDSYGDDDDYGNIRYNACPHFLYATPVCGAVDVLGLACLDAKNVPQQPRSAKHFREMCARTGGKAMCATLPLLGQGLVCKNAIGTDRK